MKRCLLKCYFNLIIIVTITFSGCLPLNLFKCDNMLGPANKLLQIEPNKMNTKFNWSTRIINLRSNLIKWNELKHECHLRLCWINSASFEWCENTFNPLATFAHMKYGKKLFNFQSGSFSFEIWILDYYSPIFIPFEMGQSIVFSAKLEKNHTNWKFSKSRRI